MGAGDWLSITTCYIVSNRRTFMTRIPANALTVFLVLATGAGAGASQATPSNAVAFVDVTVVPMRRSELRRHQTVLIEGERIVAIGSADSIRVPQRAKRISGGGRFLMPGLVDMHVHFLRRPTDAEEEDWRSPDFRDRNEDFGLLFVANGVTSVRQMHAHPVGDELMARSMTAGWFGPAIYSTGPITDGDPPEWPIARLVRKPADAVRAAF